MSTFTKSILLINLFIFAFNIFNAQNHEISFTASGEAETIDSVYVQNLSQCTDLMLYSGDILNLTETVGINSFGINNRELIIYPNPTKNETKIEFSSFVSGTTKIEIFDITGKTVLSDIFELQAGSHSFLISELSVGSYLVSINAPSNIFSGKVVSINNTTKSKNPIIKYKSTNEIFDKKQPSIIQKAGKSVVEMQYNSGEKLLFRAYSGNYSRIITLTPEESQTIDFNFIACEDADGNNYAVVTIGTQTWMAENLKTTTLNDDTDITHITVSSQWGSSSTPSYCYYNNNAANKSIYGLMYNGLVAELDNICPQGWSVPSTAQWTQLLNFLGGYTQAGGKVKDNCSGLWNAPNANATNETGFTALPGGFLFHGQWMMMGQYGHWWTSTENPENNNLFYLCVYYQDGQFYGMDASKQQGGFYLRCVKD